MILRTFYLLMLFLLAIAVVVGCGHVNGRYDGEDIDSDDSDGGGGLSTDDDDDGPSFPNFEWTGDDGETITLYDYQGKVIFLNVGAGWCVACKEETPFLESDIWDKYKDRDFVLIQLLTADENGTPADQEYCRGWRDDFGLTYLIGADPDSSLESYYIEPTLPFTMILDKNLNVALKTHGFEMNLLQAKIESLL